jgi:hypothetical protein
MVSMLQIFQFLRLEFLRPGTWIIIFFFILTPFFSWKIVRDLCSTLNFFNIHIPKEEQKKWAQLLRTLFYTFGVMFLFFFLFTHLFLDNIVMR